MQPEALQNWGHAFGPLYWDEHARVEDAVAKLKRVRDAGIRTIVDPTAPGLGRYIPRIRTVSEAADVNIIVATGVYAFLELPNFLGYRSKEAIAELFVREIREGIDDTGVKAAFLKCAVERHGLVGDVPRIIEAIAMAAKETGAPVMVHTNAEQRTGLLALDALARHGVDPARIVIAHMGDSNDLHYLKRVADAGAWLAIGSGSTTSIRCPTGSGRWSRSSRRATRDRSTFPTTRPASWTSSSEIRSSPARNRTTC
jgi:phosphotriesterase-related protein